MGGSSETGGVTAGRQSQTTPFFKRGWVSGRDTQTSTTGIVTVRGGYLVLPC